MVLDDPADQVHPLALDAKPLAGRAGGAGAGLLLAPDPALAGVVQQHGQEQGFRIGDQREHRRRKRMVLLEPSRGDVGDHPNGPERVLVDRIGVVHVELHLGDHPAELRDEPAQHPGFVHQGQGAVGALAPRQHVQEGLDRLRIAPQLRRDQPVRAGDRGEGVRMQVQVQPVGQAEQPQDVDRIGLEHLRPLDGEASALLMEARRI